jgi:threonine aldolase
MSMKFLSDNTASVAPEIMTALNAANTGRVTAYDGDPWSQRLDDMFSAFFETPVKSYAVVSGTAANSLALSVLCPPWGTILCHEEAHIERDECGAPEFFSGGAKLTLVQGENAKITPSTLTAALSIYQPMVHMVQPRALSLTQATELGCVYTPSEISALTDIAKQHKLHTHMDGARFANALVHLGCTPAQMTWVAGIDVLCFGATKNGAMAAEAVIFFNPDHAADFEFRRKRAGHLICKGRYVSAQLLAYVESGVWQRNAAYANAQAQRLADAARSLLLHPVEANELFFNLGDARISALRAQGFEFYDWGALNSGHARFVVSWDQPELEVDALVRALEKIA